jgi:diguanylate cyclase (GGDEF)-like protein
VDTRASQVAAASAATYASSAEATRSILELLERQLPGAGVFLAHLDQALDVHRIVDVLGGGPFNLAADQATALSESFCAHMSDGRGPRRCEDVAGHPLYANLAFGRATGAGAYLGVPVALSNGERIGSLAAVGRRGARFTAEDERFLTVLARVVAFELERESNRRDLQRLNASLRIQARGTAALSRLADGLTGDGDPRLAICACACEAADAPVAFLLEPAGRDYASTAMTGVDIAPVTIQARGHSTGPGRSFMRTESYFVADARSHPALAAPLVEATDARSALFEPVIRGGNVVGVLIIVWRTAVEHLDEVTAGILKLVASQAAATIERAALEAKLDALALSDPLTGLASTRAFDQELPRELARARRVEAPVCLGVVEIDHLDAFVLLRGERESERLVKEAAAAWSAALREVDMVGHLDGTTLGVLLPGCGLSEACDVLDRLRGMTPREATASAGVARWDGAEPAELLLLRCRDALAAAQAAGRNMTIADD